MIRNEKEEKQTLTPASRRRFSHLWSRHGDLPTGCDGTIGKTGRGTAHRKRTDTLSIRSSTAHGGHTCGTAKSAYCIRTEADWSVPDITQRTTARCGSE